MVRATIEWDQPLVVGSPRGTWVRAVQAVAYTTNWRLGWSALVFYGSEAGVRADSLAASPKVAIGGARTLPPWRRRCLEGAVTAELVRHPFELKAL